MKFLIFFFTVFCYASVVSARDPLPGSRYEALSGIQKSKEGKKETKPQEEKRVDVQDKSPSPFLAENLDYLPPGAQVLDVDMGDGRNAVFLARKGFKVTALEENEESLKKAKILAKEFGVRIDGILADPTQHQFPTQSFDAIVCFYRVEKKLLDRMKSWLRPSGIMIFEAHTEQETKIARGERSVKNGELLNLFGGLKILKYEEPLHRKEFTASIIIKKD